MIPLVFSGRKMILAGLMVGMMLLFAGCAKYEDGSGAKSDIVIYSDQSIDATMQRTFDQSYYSEDELVAMVDDELVQYNNEHGAEAITLKSHNLSGSDVSLTLHFRTWEDYNHFMLDRIYVGNVQGAYDERYDFNQALSYASDKEHTIGKNDLMNMADQNILVFHGDHKIEVPDKIRFYTQTLKLTGAKTAEAMDDGLYFIIY